MVFLRSHRTVLTIAAAAVLCVAALLAAGLSGRIDTDGVKHTAKTMLRGHVDPAKLDTGLPVIKIDTHNGQAVTGREKYITADIEIIDPDDNRNNLKSSVEIRGRGNTTWNAPKKPYRLKFFEKTALFGYEKAKSWVLLANYQDTTLMLNTVAFELGRRFDLPFTPHAVHAEVVLNGRYEGSYAVTEQVQTGRGRVDIRDNGFFVELDSNYDEDPKFRTPLLELPVMIKHPEGRDDTGHDAVRGALTELEAALFSGSFPEGGYRDLIDMDTLVDYIMVNEITRNVDIQLPHSVYLYREAGEGAKIKPGPLWDFDYGFDYDDEGAYFNNVSGMYRDTKFREGPGEKFFGRFFEDPRFRTKYKERWNEKYSDIAGMEMFIDKMAALLEKSARANAKVWWWNKVDHNKETERLKTWWRERIDYLNTEINKF